MASTFEKIKYASAQLPQYLGSDADSSDLVRRFKDGLVSYKASFKGSPKEFEEAAQGLCDLFTVDRELDILALGVGDCISDHKNVEFYMCAAKVRERLHKAGRLNSFLNDLKTPLPKEKRSVSSKTRNSDTTQGNAHSPGFRYSVISQYKQHQQRDILVSWKSEALVEDDGDHADLDAIISRGLLEECLYTPEGKLTYENFYTQKIESKDNTVIALQGGLGVGKTQLTQYIVLKKLAEKEDNVILFIGQRSSSSTAEGKELLRAFKNQKFKRERKIIGKFYIIIDEPSADSLRWTKNEWEKLHNAAKHYQAKIILLVRDHSSDEDLLQYFHVNSANIVQLQEAGAPISLPEGGRQWIDPTKIPDLLLDELRRLPLFRLLIDNQLWRLSNHCLSSTEELTCCFRNAYALIDNLYAERLRDKEVHTGANKKALPNETFYLQCDKLLQYVAFKLCENNGSVSLTEGAPNQLAIWGSLIDDGFVKNIIKIESRRGQESQGVIKGFYYGPFYHYFLVRELRDRLISSEGLEDALSLLIDKSADMLQYNMLADGLYDMANDIKQKAVKNLESLKMKDKKFTKLPYKKTIAILLDLLKS